MVVLSAIPKLDVFQIAEGLHHEGMLSRLYTGFASEKNRFINNFVSRKDREKIPAALITDLWPIPILQRYHKSSIYNEAYDRVVSQMVRKQNYKAILAWSGMAEHSLTAAKKSNKFAVVGRGSCHINVQNQIMSDEYLKYGIRYRIDHRITRKELIEYQIADKIYVSSSFVKRSFVDNNIPEDKIFLNPIAVPDVFKVRAAARPNTKFIILFVGRLTIRKGLRYLFEALEKVNIPMGDFEAWFVGAAEPVIRQEFEVRKKTNWKYFGFIPQSRLSDLICQADLGIFPSLEDGFAQVVPQQLSCGLPVITTSHTGSCDFIRDGYNGYIVEPCNSDIIAEKIETVFHDSQLLDSLKRNAAGINLDALSPRVVAERFANFFRTNV